MDEQARTERKFMPALKNYLARFNFPPRAPEGRFVLIAVRAYANCRCSVCLSCRNALSLHLAHVCSLLNALALRSRVRALVSRDEFVLCSHFRRLNPLTLYMHIYGVSSCFNQRSGELKMLVDAPRTHNFLYIFCEVIMFAGASKCCKKLHSQSRSMRARNSLKSIC